MPGAYPGGHLTQYRKGPRRFPEEMMPPSGKVCRILSNEGGREGQFTHMGGGSRHRGMEAWARSRVFQVVHHGPHPEERARWGKERRLQRNEAEKRRH